MIRTRSPLSPGPKPWFSLDLHVLGAPPAFVLSQDQTLHQDLEVPPESAGGSLRSESCRRRSLTSSGNFVPPRTGHYRRFVYDTELTCGRCRPVETGRPAPALALGFHCSVFKKRLSDDRTRRWCRRDTRHHSAGSLAGRRRTIRARGPARSKAGRQTLVSTGPVVPGPRRAGDPACGARRETTERRTRESNSVVQVDPGPLPLPDLDAPSRRARPGPAPGPRRPARRRS